MSRLIDNVKNRVFGRPCRIDINKLRTGDILLTRSPSAISRIIRVGTFGKFSHAMICSGAPLFTEAVGLGVINVNIRNFYARNSGNIVVLRVRDNAHIAIAEKAGGIASASFGSKYSVLKAVNSAVPLSRSIDDYTTFCSMLVAASYERAGLSLIDGRDPGKITPKHVAKCKLFHDITKSVLIHGDIAEFTGMECLEDNRQMNPAREQTVHMQKIVDDYVDRVVEIAEKFGRPVIDMPNMFPMIFYIGILFVEEPAARSDLLALDKELCVHVQALCDGIEKLKQLETRKLIKSLAGGGFGQSQVDYYRDIRAASARGLAERKESLEETSKLYNACKLECVLSLMMHHESSLKGIEDRIFMLDSYFNQIA